MNESGDTSSSDSRPSEHENKQQLVRSSYKCCVDKVYRHNIISK